MTDVAAPSSPITVEPLLGVAAAPHLAAVAALRIAVFREWPYLYEGTLDYERSYLAGYAAGERNLIVLARDGAEVVGAATAMPLGAHSDDVIAPLAAAGLATDDVYYFGESVLLPGHRGRRLGHAFFDQREAHARRFGYRWAAFCAVERPRDHPARPAGYQGHDVFWGKRGFVRRPDIVGTMRWLDVGHAEETDKAMVFWLKELV